MSQSDTVNLIRELMPPDSIHDQHQLGRIEVLVVRSAAGRWIRIEVDAAGKIDWKVRR